MKQLGRVILFLKPYWATALGAFLSLILVTVATLISPQLLRYVIDKGITVSDMQAIFVGTGGLLVVALMRGLFTFLQGFLSEKASQSLAYDLRNTIFNKLQTLSFSYYDQQQTGQLMTRATNDVEQVRTFASIGFLQIIAALITLIGTATVLFITSWRLALVTLLVVPLMLGTIMVLFSQVRKRFQAVQQKLSLLNSILQESMAGARVVRAFAREPYEIKRFDTANQSLMDENIAIMRAFSINFPTVFFIGGLGSLAITWLGGIFVIQQSLTLGELVAFSAYLGFLFMPIFVIGNLSIQLSRASVSANRVFEVLDAHVEIMDKPNAIVLKNVQGRVAFDHVSFRYLGAERDILHDVSFVAEPGERVAILGATGSGKSTIINLIPRFYDVTSGKITIDDHDIRDVTLDSLRAHIGIVLQETTLFSGTIRENIAYGRPEATMDDVIAAAQAAQAHNFILSFPEGYDTMIGERGVGLSGGQKQRIAIARALLLNPRILILDDSTSSVDTETEFLIQQALDKLMKGRTSFVIAQRISTVRQADKIIVLEDGEIVAQGTHEQLIDESPVYADILASQVLSHEEHTPVPVQEVTR